MANSIFVSNSQNNKGPSSGNRPNEADRMCARLAALLNRTRVNYGNSGDMTQDLSYWTYNLPAVAADTDIWLLDLITNDMRLRPKTALGKQWTKDFMTACLSHGMFGVKKTARTGAATTVGTWANTQVDDLGMYTTAANAKKTFDVTGNAVSVCWVADYHSASQGVFEIRIDGVLVDTVSIYIPFGVTYNNRRYAHAARIYEAGEGSHTVEVKCITSGTNAYLSYVAGSGDQTHLPKTYIGTGSKTIDVPDAYSGECRQMVLDHVDFLSEIGLPVKVVDTYAALELPQHFMSDGIHWNIPGHDVVLDLSVAAATEPPEPQTLSWPYIGGGTFVVELDSNEIVTDYYTVP